MVADKSETVRSLLRKKFVRFKEGANHLYLAYFDKGEPVAVTCVSHGGRKDLAAKRIREMGEQCHLTKDEFYAFAKCHMTEEQYRQILIDKGIIKGD
jgi:hypothetical protein